MGADRRWTYQELTELFYQALLRDEGAGGFTAIELRGMAHAAAMGAVGEQRKVASQKAQKR